MIQFKIVIESRAEGLNIHCETPPGVASPEEVQAALSFKRLFGEWAQKQSALMTREWKSPNNEIGEDN